MPLAAAGANEVRTANAFWIQSFTGTAEGKEDFYKQLSMQAARVAFALALQGPDNTP